jgi:glycosyltransferase involved in cell wall biosynthesis
MRIAIIGQKGIPAIWGGVEVHVDHLSRGLVEAGHQVDVYVRDWYTPRGLKSYGGVRLFHLPTIHTKYLDAPLHVLAGTLHALTHGADIIHYQAIGPAAFGFLPRLAGKKVVATIHARDWAAGKWGAIAQACLKASEALAVKIPHRTIVVSETLRNELGKRYGRETTVIPHGMLPPVFRPARLIRERWGLEPGRYVLYLGRLVAEKRADWLIESWRDLRRSVPETAGLKLVIAGGSSATGEYARRIKSMAGNERSIVLTGSVQGEIKEELLSHTALFLLPSRLEGFPIAILEARAYGLCCLASDIPPHREIIRDGWDGRLFHYGDRADMTNRWRELIARPEQTAEMGRRARTEAAGRPDWDEIARRTSALYRTITDGVPPRNRP